MIRTLSDAAAGAPEALQGISAFAALLAFIPSAIIFIINQIQQNKVLRDDKHRYIIERYQYFLERSLELPKLRVAYGEPASDKALTQDELYQRDILFDLLTSIFEQSYLTYANRISSNRQRQWGGWDDFIGHYATRSDYREWWKRVVLAQPESSDDIATKPENVSQYDTRFELYLVGKLDMPAMPGLPLKTATDASGRRRKKPVRQARL